MFPMTLSTQQFLRALKTLEGFSVHQASLSRWARSGALTPSARVGARGVAGHVYTPGDLLRGRLLARLRMAGVPLARAVAVIDRIGPDLAAVVRRRGAALVVDGFRVTVVTARASVELPSGQVRLPLSGLALSDDELREVIAA